VELGGTENNSSPVEFPFILDEIGHSTVKERQIQKKEKYVKRKPVFSNLWSGATSNGDRSTH